MTKKSISHYFSQTRSGCCSKAKGKNNYKKQIPCVLNVIVLIHICTEFEFNGAKHTPAVSLKIAFSVDQFMNAAPKTPL